MSDFKTGFISGTVDLIDIFLPLSSEPAPQLVGFQCANINGEIVDLTQIFEPIQAGSTPANATGFVSGNYVVEESGYYIPQDLNVIFQSITNSPQQTQSPPLEPEQEPFTATGSYIQGSNDDYNTFLIFNGNGTLTFNSTVGSVDLFLVGGGSGGSDGVNPNGGIGGIGGEILYAPFGTFGNAGNSYNIIIGEGGANNTDGSETTITGSNNFSAIASGGVIGTTIDDTILVDGFGGSGGNGGKGSDIELMVGITGLNGGGTGGNGVFSTDLYTDPATNGSPGQVNTGGGGGGGGGGFDTYQPGEGGNGGSGIAYIMFNV
jgi:hypothetical protein